MSEIWFGVAMFLIGMVAGVGTFIFIVGAIARRFGR